MKGKKLLATFALVLTLVCTSGVYAASTNSNKGNTNSSQSQSYQCGHGNKLGFRKITNKNGFDYVNSVLKNKFKITDEEIANARESGKSMHDLIKEKGINLEDFKKALLEEKSKAIDEAVKSGKITKENADAIKNRIKNNMNNCNGEGKSRINQRGGLNKCNMPSM